MLTVVTVLALPINLIAGLLGMNVGGVPLNQNPNGSWIVLMAVLSITTVAGWIGAAQAARTVSAGRPHE